jgi:hypothetical protein
MAALAAAAACAAACGGDDGVTPPRELTGNYRLVSVNSNVPPYVFWCGLGACEQINHGRIEFMSRGRLREIAEFQTAGQPSTQVVDTLILTYEFDGSRLILKRTPFGGSAATVADTALVQNDQRQITFRPKVLHGHLTNGGAFFYTKE